MIMLLQSVSLLFVHCHFNEDTIVIVIDCKEFEFLGGYDIKVFSSWPWLSNIVYIYY